MSDEPDAQLDAIKSTAAIAWGWLWHITTTDRRINAAQHVLGEMLDKDMKRYGIKTAKAEGAEADMREVERWALCQFEARHDELLKVLKEEDSDA